ncbi:hypothetical protein [Micrococcus terreus]|uniref:Uncharacterized protein n=1 Tax=Micrococcus terreus TaxID=574650 RepID=A0A1I7MQY6_9MICC|nr:hypothetical protein [Micrococcus terreus]SFV24313.1 hypothetical protein SAMN04487966_110101 [Micrococcus terreus]
MSTQNPTVEHRMSRSDRAGLAVRSGRPGRAPRRAAGLALAIALAAYPLATALPAAATPSASATSSGSADANPRGPVPVYEPAGEQVTGGSDLAGAVEIQPGVHWDTLEAGDSEGVSGDGTQRFYTLPALQEGERLYAAAVLAVDTQQRTDSNGMVGLEFQLVNQQGESCSSRDTTNHSASSPSGHPVVTAVTDPMDPERSYGCFEDGSGIVAAQVQRTGTWQSDTPMPVELHFWVAPPVDESQLNAAPTSAEAPQSVTITGEATPLEGGSSFATAVEATPGQVHEVEIRPSQVQYFKVPVEYGQRLNYRLAQGNNQDASVARVEGRIFTPLLRRPDSTNSYVHLFYDTVGEVVTQSTSVTTSPDNHGSHSYGSLSIAGDYYIVVSASNARANRQGSQPFRYQLAVELTGEPGGTTDWVTAAQEQAAEAAGDGAENGENGGQPQAAGSGGGMPTGAELGALAGGIGLGALLSGVAWLLLRRRGQQA